MTIGRFDPAPQLAIALAVDSVRSPAGRLPILRDAPAAVLGPPQIEMEGLSPALTLDPLARANAFRQPSRQQFPIRHGFSYDQEAEQSPQGPGKAPNSGLEDQRFGRDRAAPLAGADRDFENRGARAEARPL